MKKGPLVDFMVILFICSLALSVVTGYNVLKLKDKDYQEYSESAKDIRGSVTAVENSQKEFAAVTVSQMAELTKRMAELETKKVEPKEVNLNLRHPVTFTVVYKNEHKEPTVLPDPPSTIKNKTPLLNRAGITKRKSAVTQ